MTEVRAAGENRTARRILFVTLPVAGTTIVSSALYGTWTVEAHLDGAETPCAKGLELKIYP